jgi:hypothetical protein
MICNECVVLLHLCYVGPLLIWMMVAMSIFMYAILVFL